MLWHEMDFAAFERPLARQVADMFAEFPSVAAGIERDPLGLAAASHLANRLKLLSPEQHQFDPSDLELEYEGTLAAITTRGVADKGTCLDPGLCGYESVPYLLTPGSAASDPTCAATNAAWGLIRETPFAYVADRLSGVAVIALDHQRFPNTNQSYTILPVMQTVYVDIYEHRLLTAESLVHEHAHLTFNNYVRYHRLTFDPTPRFYSPWKEQERPLFNFLHSIIAFCEVVEFLNAVDPRGLDEQGRRYLDMKLKFEVANIAGVRAAADVALKATPDRAIAERIHQRLDRVS